MKSLYQGNFNYKGEIFTFYRHAINKFVAKQYMIVELAEILGISPAPLRNYFFGLQDNFSIKGVEKEVI